MYLLTDNTRDLSPGEFSTASDAKYNACQNEKTYITTFGAALKTAGMPNHAIIDTGRNAVQKLRAEWGNWCNVKGAGFGVRPTADTGTELADAFVWVKVCSPNTPKHSEWSQLTTSSPAENRMVRQTRRRRGTTASAARMTHTSRALRLDSGTRRTLRT